MSEQDHQTTLKNPKNKNAVGRGKKGKHGELNVSIIETVIIFHFKINMNFISNRLIPFVGSVSNSMQDLNVQKHIADTCFIRNV